MTCRSPLDICALRLTRLESDGTPDYDSITGAVALVSGISSLTWTAQYVAVPAVQEVDGCGGLSINLPAEQLLAGYQVKLDVLVESDELHEIGYGATLLDDGGSETVGYAVMLDSACGVPSLKNGVLVEGWAKNLLCDEVDSDFPYRRVVFSKVKFTPGDGGRQRGPNHLVLTGSSFVNSSLGDGPFHDFPSDMPAGFAKAEFSDTALPDADADCGYTTTPALS